MKRTIKMFIALCYVLFWSNYCSAKCLYKCLQILYITICKQIWKVNGHTKRRWYICVFWWSLQNLNSLSSLKVAFVFEEIIHVQLLRSYNVYSWFIWILPHQWATSPWLSLFSSAAFFRPKTGGCLLFFLYFFVLLTAEVIVNCRLRCFLNNSLVSATALVTGKLRDGKKWSFLKWRAET